MTSESLFLSTHPEEDLQLVTRIYYVKNFQEFRVEKMNPILCLEHIISVNVRQATTAS